MLVSAEAQLIRIAESTDLGGPLWEEELLDQSELIMVICASYPEDQFSRIIKQQFPALDKRTLHSMRNWLISQLSRHKDRIFPIKDLETVIVNASQPGEPFFAFHIRPGRDGNPDERGLMAAAQQLRKLLG